MCSEMLERNLEMVFCSIWTIEGQRERDRETDRAWTKMTKEGRICLGKMEQKIKKE